MGSFAGLFVIVLIICFFWIGYLNNVKKEEEKKNREIEAKARKQAELEREANLLLKKGTFVRDVSDALSLEYKKQILQMIDKVGNGYNPETYRDFNKAFLIDCEEICYNELMGARVISFNKIGYHNLDVLKVNPVALAIAICKYSDKWKGARTKRREGLAGYYDVGGLETNGKYWNPYFQAHFASHCAKKNIKPLKKI